MLKKILIGLGIVVVLLSIAFVYLNNRNRTLSPSGNVSLSNSGLTVNVDYSRPSVRGRLIFGKEEDGALLPHGKFWRLGANEPTTLTVDQDFAFDGNKVRAGKYTLYAIPEAGKMILKLNSDIKFWGIIEPESTNDVAISLVDMIDNNQKTEQFTIQCESISGGVNVVFFWDRYYWEIPITIQ